ncbi:uncharacterized protein [Parasteatoda tepidariorum]|uniref:uncharacterized protein n=1 Tax=Parasteatoda tepidariorum TaxID=114398 RepID=UPI001C71FBF7|nr:uncharacterized protein LOC122268354 [Parasteatoda tepidariorum]
MADNSSELFYFSSNAEQSTSNFSSTVPSLISEHHSHLEVDYDGSKDIFPLYRISFMWLIAIGFFIAYVVGYFSSIILNLIKGKTEQVAPELISPLVKYFYFEKPQKAAHVSDAIKSKNELSEMEVIRRNSNFI